MKTEKMRENTSMKTSRAARLASPLTAQRGGERSRVWWAEEDAAIAAHTASAGPASGRQ